MSDPMTHPAKALVPITLDDNVDLPNGPCRGFHVNVGGTLRVHPKNSSTPIDLVVLDGAYYPYEIKRFMSTGSTATTNFAIF